MDSPTPDKFSPRIYANYPVLDQVLLEYLGIEELVARHKVNPEFFEHRSSLNLLARRFNLAPALSFRDFLLQYDQQYATVRSYFLPGAKPKAILLQAAEAGNLEAFYIGIKLYRNHRAEWFLNDALSSAARGGHPIMIELVKALGKTNPIYEVIGTAEGGHLSKLKTLIAHNDLTQGKLHWISTTTAFIGQLETFKYLVSLWTPSLMEWSQFLFEAGKGGNQGVIDYIISQGQPNYTKLIQGAIEGDKIDLALKYLNMLGVDYDRVFKAAVSNHKLELAKLVAKGRTIDLNVLNQLLGSTKKEKEADYLISLGGDNYGGLIHTFAISNNLELFKKYYRPGIYCVRLFQDAIRNTSLEVIEFMIQQGLVGNRVEDLNEYLHRTLFDNFQVIDLLFSLGATDYIGIVKAAITSADFDLADKYFDQANLDVNKLFQEATRVKVYKYLARKDKITQATLDATLDKMSQITIDGRRDERDINYLISLGAV
jgi:hypothetical protein